MKSTRFAQKAISFFRRYIRAVSIKDTKAKDWRQTLDSHRRSTSAQSPKNGKQRILYGPAFSIHDPCFALDRIISSTLAAQGMEVIPIYCDGIQDIECNVFGGLWSGGASFKANCELCQRRSEDLWNTSSTKAIRLSSAIEESDKAEILTSLDSIADDELLNYQANGIPYGRLAKDITVNNFLVSTLSLVPNHTALLRQQIANLLICERAYFRIIERTKPDIIISNDSYYGMWRVLQILAKGMNIPFYSHWPTTIDRFAVAKDDAAMNLNMRSSWENYKMIGLTDDDRRDANYWLNGKRNLALDTTSPESPEKTESVEQLIDPEKPTVLLAANVIWDLAALDKQLVFDDMISWISETISWFGKRMDCQLIVKPHPAETFSSIPKTTEMVEDGIARTLKKIPPNVFVLRPSTSLTVLKILELANIKAAVVHTTTVGYEFPAQGIPSIVTGNAPYRGFGFTVDPESKRDYFIAIEKALAGELNLKPEQVELSLKFLNLYQFRYYVKHGLFHGKDLVLSKGWAEAIEKPEGAFGYVIDSIIAKKPILSKTKWPPKS